MRDRQPERDGGIADQCQPHERMAVEIEVVLQRLGHGGPGRCWPVLVSLAALFASRSSALASLSASFCVSQPSWIVDLTIMGDGDEHLAALLLRHLDVFVLVETLADFEDFHLGPSGFQKRVSLGGDGAVLQGPEQIGVGEIAVLAEQILHGLAGVIGRA